ncbi:hypothetical protein [Escherichia coli]|uniref:hypothetical protein n=1 Tax=Escherichia coli TaxID=562 RepID=UPI003D657A4B
MAMPRLADLVNKMNFQGRLATSAIQIGTTAAWRLQIENRPGSSCCCRTPRRICML